MDGLNKRDRQAVLVAVLALISVWGIWTWQRVTVEAQPSHPTWTCSLDDISTTLTQCGASPTSGFKLYLTDVIIASTTATGGQYIVRSGTGTNCGTGTASLLPSGASVVRLGYPGNTIAAAHVGLSTPLAAPRDAAICLLCVGTNTCAAQLVGYEAP